MSLIEPALTRISDHDLLDFTEAELKRYVSADFIGNTIIFLAEVDSTNIVASHIAHDGAPTGTAVIADCQLRGKGRLSRVWQSPPKRNIYTSIILRPSIKPSRAPQLTLTAGVAVAEVLARYCPDGVTLKWPNDIQIRGKKVCGILTEMRTSGGQIDYIVVGMGININMQKDEFQEEFRETSTSLREETGRAVNRVDFLARLYRSFETWYDRYLEEGFAPIKNRWLGFSGILNRHIQVSNRGKVATGKGLGIDDYGALLLYDEENNIQHIIAGDVSVIGDS